MLEVVMKNPEHQPVQSPNLEVLTYKGPINLDYENALMVMHPDVRDNHIEYYPEDEVMKPYNILEPDWDRMVERGFPFEYRPDLDEVDSSFSVRIKFQDNNYKLRPNNTRIRLFGNDLYNHVEHEADSSLRGIALQPELMKELFNYEFPMLYLPYVDKSSKKWYQESHGLK